MIHHTITFVAITPLNLALVVFTMDAAIWRQTNIATDMKYHHSGTAHQEMAATDTHGNLSNVSSTVHNESHISLDDLVSAFNSSSYVGNCSDLLDRTDAQDVQFISYDDEFHNDVLRTAWEMCGKFNGLIETAWLFVCTENTTLGHDVISMSQVYVHRIRKVMVGLNSSTAAEVEVAVLDAVADLYRTSAQYVQSVMELVEYLTAIISEEFKLHAAIETLHEALEVIDSFYNASMSEISVEKQNEPVNLLKNILERVGNMSEHNDENPFTNAITSGTISRFFNAQYWAEKLENETQVLLRYQTELREVKGIEFLLNTVTPVIMGTILVVGMGGNGLLLTIFVSHKETRTIANCMLINLTVVDLASLVVNLILDYLRVTIPWQMDALGCQIFMFFSYMLFAVSTYCVAMLSVQRFVAVRQLPSLAWCHRSNTSKYVLIAIVWGIGNILSVPHAVYAEIVKTSCRKAAPDYFGPMHTADLIVFCVVPLLITAVFSGLTAQRIRRSVYKIPGEATGQKQFKHNRMVSSNVLVALTVLFVVSYAPDFLLNYLLFEEHISMSTWLYVLVNTITYHLRFVNCCLNPIVLFVMCKRYRQYITRYCGQREVQRASSSGSTIVTKM